MGNTGGTAGSIGALGEFTAGLAGVFGAAVRVSSLDSPGCDSDAAACAVEWEAFDMSGGGE